MYLLILAEVLRFIVLIILRNLDTLQFLINAFQFKISDLLPISHSVVKEVKFTRCDFNRLVCHTLESLTTIKRLLLTFKVAVDHIQIVIKSIGDLGLFMSQHTTLQLRLSFDVKFCHLTSLKDLLTHTVITRQRTPDFIINQPVAVTKARQLAKSR